MADNPHLQSSHNNAGTQESNNISPPQDNIAVLENIPHPIDRPVQETISEKKKGDYSSLAGFIDQIIGNKIHGWIFTAAESVTPLIFVNGQPATLLTYPDLRTDVSQVLGVPDATGFSFEFSNFTGPTLVQLYAITNKGLTLLSEKTFEKYSTSADNFLSQLDKAVEISKDPDSVAIACWDDNHNPIGRAKVLYDIAAQKRPTILISYSFSEFGSELWAPIQDLPFNFLSIPWDKRHKYESLIRSVGLTFPTIWISKPRYPNFILTKLIASKTTKLVLDLDDNDFFFSQSQASKNKAYGSLTLNQCKHYTKQIKSRTAASISLANEFDAKIVRHAREPYEESISLLEKFELEQQAKIQEETLLDEALEEGAAPSTGILDSETPEATIPELEAPETGVEDTEEPEEVFGPLKIGFIGTVRSHKGLIEAARAMRVISWKLKSRIDLHVCGDIRPVELNETLQTYGAITYPSVPRNELYQKLSEYDIVLAGYPAPTAEPEITDYQISAKIGDALAVERPVLVPLSPSTEDLDNIDGVFLYTNDTLMQQIKAARQFHNPITLPAQFTLDGAYKSFQSAETNATTAMDAGLFTEVIRTQTEQKSIALQPTIVLIWKQHDAGLYGRRVDQIARYYKRIFKSHKVIILELLHERTLEHYLNHAGSFHDETHKIMELANEKAYGLEDADGVLYHQIQYNSSDRLKGVLEDYFLENQIFPSNSIITLFPIIQNIEKAYKAFNDYKVIVDFVDNQTSWAGYSDHKKVLPQYAQTARLADRILFNSEENAATFEELGIINNKMRTFIVRNWFMPPVDLSIGNRHEGLKGPAQILYSGNLNDRVNWDLFEKIADSYPDAILNIAGSIRSQGEKSLHALLERENVFYHGPLSERDVVIMLQKTTVAIVPHTVSDVSRYMNPLKVEMYKSMEVPVVTSDVPGITNEEGIIVAQTDGEFVSLVGELIEGKQLLPTSGVFAQEKLGANYLKIIQGLRNEINDENVKDEDIKEKTKS